MILVRCKGGLGNQMFQYAAGRSLALRHGVELKLDAQWYAEPANQTKAVRSFDLHHFRVAAPLATEDEAAAFGLRTGPLGTRLKRVWQRFAARRQRWMFDEMGYSDTFETLGPDVALEGYFQHPRYFAEIEDRLRAEFCVRDAPPVFVRELAAEFADRRSVCVQVRRGDFALPAVASFHGLCGEEYYRRAWTELCARVSGAEAYVFTDDAAWADEHLSFLKAERIFADELAGPAFVHKFFLMQACRHFISANSTFGWWAAWLGARSDSVVIAPRVWLRTRDIDELGLRLPGWLAC